MIDTLIGCALAWLGVSFIWPDWKFRRLPRTIRRAIQAQCNYLVDVVQQYHHGRNHGLSYRIARRTAHNTDADVASLISTLATEPDFDPIQKIWHSNFCAYIILFSVILLRWVHIVKRLMIKRFSIYSIKH